MSNSENNNQDTNTAEPVRKKLSLKEAMEQKLASKKQEQAASNHSTNSARNNTNIKSQLTKKPSTQRRKMGE